MKSLFLGLAVLTLAACSSVSAVNKYYYKELRRIGKKYGTGDLRSSFTPDHVSGKLTKSDAKKTIKAIEAIVASKPDSVSLVDPNDIINFQVHKNQPKVDSFYSNKRKIEFLTNNNLLTSNKKIYNQ